MVTNDLIKDSDERGRDFFSYLFASVRHHSCGVCPKSINKIYKP